MQYFELSKQHGKKDTEISQFLKSATALRWNFYPIFRTSIEWKFCDCLLEKCVMQNPVFLRLSGPNILHNN